jgi:hypothetical protein
MKPDDRTTPARPAMVLALAAALAMLLAVAGPPRAGAQQAAPDKPDEANCASGRTVPASKISIQLYTFNRYVDFGERADEAPAGAPGPQATRAERLEFVFAFLSEVGYRNIEPFSFHGLSVEEFDALADKYGLKVPSRHMSTNEANWAANIADAKLLGQRWTGSGGFASPGTGSYENTLATAETMNRLGKRSVKNGTGQIFGHNHADQFETMYVDAQGDGTLKTAWQILVENTDPRWVTFQLDVGWAVIGDADPVALMEEFGDRIAAVPRQRRRRHRRANRAADDRRPGRGRLGGSLRRLAGEDQAVRHRAGSAGRALLIRRGELRVRRLPGLLIR